MSIINDIREARRYRERLLSQLQNVDGSNLTLEEIEACLDRLQAAQGGKRT